MSWSRARAFKAAVVLTLGLLVAACGFQPLYRAAPGGASGPLDELAAVRIEPLPDRLGQQVHNMLRDRLNPNGQPAAPKYRLNVVLSEAVKELGIRKDETATRANLVLSAAFRLNDAATNRELHAGRSSSINSYNILDSQFATQFSRANARGRSVREVADDIRTRLAIYFARIAARGP